jgi:2'-5' RNA ligase
MKRLFAAVKIYPSGEFIKLYDSLRTGLKFASIKWVPTENIHVTLKFFGETPEDRIAAIVAALRSAALKHQSFKMELKNVGIFGSSYDPRVIWFGMEKTEPIAALTNTVFVELEKTGWHPDRQNFVPHLTVGRIKYVPDKRLFQTVIDDYKIADIQVVEVREFHLYESILRKEGPLYTILETYKLGS